MQIIHPDGTNIEIRFHRWLLFPSFLKAADLSIHLVLKKKEAYDTAQRFILTKSIHLSATTQTYLGLKYLQHGRKAKY